MAFIDFKKAYDSIDRGLLWSKMASIGIGNKVLSAIKGIYQNVSCCVKINGLDTNWFEVTTGLKQGCLLSPLLFNIYINDLVNVLKENCQGVKIGGENVCVLMYADDLALIAQNERDLQKMLDTLFNWCEQWRIKVNTGKSEIVHFRQSRSSQTKVQFKYGNSVLNLVKFYKYLGIVLNEFLDYAYTAAMVAKSANRALGLLIAKTKCIGGLPLTCFEKLYNSIVLPVIHYGSAVWGSKDFSCINSVHFRACRFIMGVGKNTSNAAVLGDTGLLPPFIDQWICITRYWCRIVNMSNTRLNKKIFVWANSFAKNGCKNSVWKEIHMFKECGIYYLMAQEALEKDICVGNIRKVLEGNFHKKWLSDLNRVEGIKGKGGNKLRMYKNFKKVFEQETYLNCIIGRNKKSAYAKFRCGVAPIRIETGRYENLKIEERVCPFCIGIVEDEVHVLTECSLYIDFRDELWKIISESHPLFINLSGVDKYIFMMSAKEPWLICLCSKTCCDILTRRKYFLTCKV